jgi:hypothetical protein
MADQLNTEEFQYQLDQIIELMKKGIPLSEAQVKAIESSTKAHKASAAELNAAFNKLGRGTRDLGQSMLDGKRGMEAMTGGVNAVAGAAELLISIIPGMRLLKIALTAAVGVIAYFTKETSKQADALFKTYQDLSKTGQAAAGGMEEIYKNMQQFGYNIDELGKMSALLKENSQALASFGGTAAAGGKAFANAAEQIQRSDLGRTFQMMGMLPDDINRGMAMYIKSQQAIGIRNTDINKNLGDSAGKYVMQLDLLAKLTGQTAEQTQEKLDQANAEQAFNQVQNELKKKALAGDEEARKQFIENQIVATTLTGTALKEFQQGLGGDLSAMSKTMMTASGAVALIGRGSFTAAELFNAYGEGAEQFRQMNGQLMKYNAADHGLPVSEISQMESRFAGRQAEMQQKRAEAEQLLQKTGLEPTTKNMVTLQMAQMNTTNSFQNLINFGINPVTNALSTLAKGIEYIASYLPGTKTGVSGKVGGGTTGSGGGAGSGGAGGGGMGAGAPMTQGGLAALGLRIRPSGGDVQAEGAGVSDNLISLARNIQTNLGDFAYFSGFNDKYHMEKSPGSLHTQGRALDFVLSRAPNKEEGARLVATLKSMGASYARDEYNDKSDKATGDHIHAEVSARNGFRGLLSGPSSGYMPNIEMHGREQLSITPANAGSTANLMGGDSTEIMKKQLEKMDQMVQGINQAGAQNIMAMQLDRLDELVRVMQNQVNVSTKILQQSR